MMTNESVPVGTYEPTPLSLLPDVDPREGKLPAWAQRYISRIRAVARHNLADAIKAQDHAAKALLATDPTTTDTLIDPWDNAPVGLPPGSQIHFRMGVREYFDVRNEGGRLEILASHPLLISPVVSNHLSLHIPR